MRRGFDRPVRRMFGRDIPPLLRRANQLMATGNFVEAASAFEQLARAAEARNGPRTPFFYIQAGRAQIMAGQTDGGIEYLERGLGLFAVRGQIARVFNLANRLVWELNQRGLSIEAKQVSDYISSLLPDLTPEPGIVAAKRTPLPTHCLGCGAPVHPEEVEWLDDVTAECAYCGSLVRGE